MNNDFDHIKFDSKLKNKLSNHEMDGTEELWSSIEIRVNEDRYRKKFIFYRWLSLFMIGVVISIVFFYELNDNEAVNKNYLVKEPLFKELTTDPLTHTESIEEFAKIDSVEVTKETNTSLQSKETKYLASINVSKNKIDKKKEKNRYNSQPYFEITLVDSLQVQKTEDVDSIAEILMVENDSISTVIIVGDSLLADIEFLKNDSTIEMNDSSNAFVTEKNEFYKLDSVKLDLNNQVKSKRFNLSAYVAPMYSYRSLRNNPTVPMSSEIVANFNQSESAKFSYEFGIDFGIKLRKKWSLTTGVNFANLGYKYNPQNIHLVHDTINNQLSLNSSIGNQEFSGTVIDNNSQQSQVEENEFSFKSKINLSVISVPFGIERYVSFNKHSLVLESSITCNYILSNSLTINQINFEEEELSNDIVLRNIKGVNRFFIGSKLGFGYQYNLNNKLAFMVKPNIFVSFRELNPNTIVKSFPLSYGIKTGVKFSF